MTLILSGTDGLSDVDGSAATPAIRGTDANTGIFFPAADTIAFSEGGLESMRIDASGRLGIGATSPSGKLVVVGGNANTAILDNDNSQYTQLLLQRNSTANTGGDLLIDGTNATMSLRMLAVGAMRFCTSTSVGDGTERMRIDSSGNLLVGTTSGTDGRIKIDGTLNANNCAVWAKNSAGASSGTYVCWNAATSGNNQFIDFYTETAATVRGSLYYDRTANQTKLAATSDQRLKENIVDAPSALPVVAQIKVRQYDWKETGSTNIGFVAQELHQVVERAVAVGEDNEDGSIKRPWGVDNVTLVPYLVKAIQEQQAIITQLQADVASLQAPQGTP
jgi:hypothetical protein